MMKKIIQIYR